MVESRMITHEDNQERGRPYYKTHTVSAGVQTGVVRVAFWELAFGKQRRITAQ